MARWNYQRTVRPRRDRVMRTSLPGSARRAAGSGISSNLGNSCHAANRRMEQRDSPFELAALNPAPLPADRTVTKGTVAVARSRGRFRRVLARPGVPGVLGAYLLSRLAATMIVLSLLLLAQAETGSFASAGTLTACFAAGTALAAPLLGRAVDRRGQRLVLGLCALAAPLALVAVVLFLRQGVLVGSYASAVAAGALLPPVTSCMRTLWPVVVAEESLLDTAWAIESLVVEATELAGPLLAGALLALADPAAGLLVAAGLTYAGPMLFALSRSAAGPRAGGAPAVRRLGPLKLAPVRSMLVIIGLTTAGLAATEVAITDAATLHGERAVTGVLFAIWLGGSLLGGWIYGRRSWSAPPEALQPLLLAGCAGLGLVMLIAPFGVGLAAALCLAGLAVAPATAVQFALMSRIAPEDARTETFTWASTAGFLGMGLGSWAAGAVISGDGSLSWWIASGFSALAALEAWRSAGRYRPAIEVARQREPSESFAEVVAVAD